MVILVVINNINSRYLSKSNSNYYGILGMTGINGSEHVLQYIFGIILPCLVWADKSNRVVQIGARLFVRLVFCPSNAQHRPTACTDTWL